MGVDRAVVLSKLERLANCIKRIESKKPFSADQLQADPDLQGIFSINLQRSIQTCADLAAYLVSETSTRMPDSMAQAFSVLGQQGTLTAPVADRMAKAVGLRNILVHEYEEINWSLVHDLIENHLDLFAEFSSQILSAYPR